MKEEGGRRKDPAHCGPGGRERRELKLLNREERCA
jgi:hypothetical protein